MRSPVYQISQYQGQWMFSLWDEDGDSVAPKTLYPTKELAVARLMQMMGITESIAPQSHPERICIGKVFN